MGDGGTVGVEADGGGEGRQQAEEGVEAQGAGGKAKRRESAVGQG